MKRKFKIMQHQIEQLKEEVSAKDLALVKEHFDHMKVEKEKDSLKMELSKARSHISDIDEQIAKQRIEVRARNGTLVVVRLFAGGDGFSRVLLFICLIAAACFG